MHTPMVWIVHQVNSAPALPTRLGATWRKLVPVCRLCSGAKSMNATLSSRPIRKHENAAIQRGRGRAGWKEGTLFEFELAGLRMCFFGLERSDGFHGNVPLGQTQYPPVFFSR